jgi:hypothetical protein
VTSENKFDPMKDLQVSFAYDERISICIRFCYTICLDISKSLICFTTHVNFLGNSSRVMRKVKVYLLVYFHSVS